MIDWLTRKQKVKIQGKYNYYLSLNTEFVDSSTSISITSFTDKNKKAAVPCSYIWFAIKNGLPLEVQDFRGSTFICDTNHIGYFIQAHIVSNDPDFSGKAIVTFGPVELDISLKTDILKGLSERSVSQPIYLVNSEGDEKECQLRLLESQMKIQHSFSDISYSFDYSIVEPQISVHPKEVNKITILFNEKYEADMKRFERRLFHPQDLSISNIHSQNSRNTTHSQSTPKLEVKFLNRAARDVFLFAMKAFITKREMKNSAVLRKIENINFEKEEDFTAILELQSLRRDLIRYDTLYKQALTDRKRAMDDLSKIQVQASPKINSSHYNYSTQLSGRKDEPTIKFQQLEKENKQLNGRINHLMDEIDAMRSNPSVLSGHLASPYAKKKKEYDNESLASLMDGLTSQVCHFDADRDNAIDTLKTEKKELEGKLERSFQQIEQLEKKLRQVPVPAVQPSGINFTYRANPIDHTQDHLRLIDTLKREMQELKRSNEALLAENRRIAADLDSKNRPGMANKIESHLSKIREQNKTTDQLIESKQEQEKMDKLIKEVEGLRETLKSKNSQIEILKKQVIELTRIKVCLEQRCLKSQRRSNELEMQLQIFRRNQDVLNRSQNISMQMDNYNEEQIRILKEHNGFLVSENEKLVKACEKYMSDAKQSNKLRQEILTLKEKMNQMLTNPEANSFQ